MKTRLVLPTTKFSIVIWYRDNVKHETLIETPFNNTALTDTMLMKHHVGFSEIRAIVSVDPRQLIKGFGRNA